MMKFSQSIAGLITATVLLSSAASVDAQNNTRSVGSLATMSCQTIGDARYETINTDFPIARQIFRGIARLSNRPRRFISGKRDAPQVVCRLAEAGQRPRYKTLSLAFGIADNNQHSHNSTLLRLSIYRDGNFYKYQDILRGQPIQLPIDVTNVRSIALEAECMRGTQPFDLCPEIIFFEDTLE